MDEYKRYDLSFVINKNAFPWTQALILNLYHVLVDYV